MIPIHTLIPMLAPLQEATVVDADWADPSFFTAIIAGVILALAFQFILTIVSVAVGVTSIGNLKKSFVKAQVQQDHPEHNFGEDDEEDEENSGSLGSKIATGFGLWSIITTAISLFAATALAFNLNTLESSGTNITMALVIWSLFFLILFYIETRVASTLIGNLIAAATSGLKASATAVTSMFAPSKEQKVERVIGNTLDRVRAEIDAGVDTRQLSEVLDRFLNRVDQKIPDLSNLKSDLEDIAKKSRSKHSTGKWMAVQQMVTKAIDQNQDSQDPSRQKKAAQLKALMEQVSEEFNRADSKKEGVKNVLESFSSVEREEIDKRHAQIESFLSKAQGKDLSREALQSKLRPYLENPALIRALLENNFKRWDRDKLISVLDENTSIPKEDLEKHADTLEDFIRTHAQKFDKENQEKLVRAMEGRVDNFFRGTGRPELDYGLLKQDIKSMLDNPKDSLNIIRHRLDTFDAETVRALVTNNRYVQDEHVDQVVDTIAKGRAEVEDKLNTIQRKSREQVALLKRKAVIRAEHARKTAIAAAWWLVASAVISAGAAILGGLTAL